MLIANPIYDAVFKFFMEDPEVAKRLISNIIGKEVIALMPKPQEISTYSKKRDLALLRLDYAAVICDSVGAEHKVIIELQKAEKWVDIQRFRRYLGENLIGTPDNTDENIAENIGETKREQQAEEQVLPIICVYFLGFKLEGIPTPYPVLRSEGLLIDEVTHTPIAEQEAAKNNDFIRLLTHTSYFIQIPYLPKTSQNLLLKRLSAFGQYEILPDKKWQKEFENWESIEDYDLRMFIRRLWLGIQSREVQEEVRAEQEIDRRFDTIERKLERAEQGKAQAEQGKAQAEQRAQTAITLSARALHQTGMNIATIAQLLQVETAWLQTILNTE